MMTERKAFVGTHVRPKLKQALLRYVDIRRQQDPRMSMSRVLEQALHEKLESEGVHVEDEASPYAGESLPFEEESVL